MKRKELLTELRKLQSDELASRGREIAEESMKLRFKKGSGQLERPDLLKKARRDLARALTVKRQQTVK